MPAGNSSSRPSGRSSGRGNSGSTGRSGSGRPSSAGRSSSGGSRSGNGRPSSGSGRPSSSSGSGRPSSSRPSSSSSGRSSSAGSSASRGGSSRPSTSRPRRDDARSDSRGTGRPSRDGDRRQSTDRRDSRGAGRPTRDGDGRPRRDDARPRRDDARSDSRGTGRPSRDGDRRQSTDRRDSRAAGRPSRDGDRRPRRDDNRDDRAPRSRRPQSDAPTIPDHITGEELHRSIRNELRSLPDGLALRVSRHMATCAELANDDPELAWKHAKAALDMASRISVVRETAADAAYNAGHFAQALSEYRAVKRMTGKKEYLPLMADCERALGRPRKAIEMAGDPVVATLPIDARVEMRIVAAGARLDMGNPEAALATLQCPELTKPAAHTWAARIRYAYADILASMDRTDEAIEWFHRAAAVDIEQVTDADDRIAQLEGRAVDGDDLSYEDVDFSDDE